VQPEGLAAVKAFLESPHAESKTYAIVDVGAGTTEVSFFFNGRIMTERGHPLRPSYLADSTQPVGGRNIDRELGQAWNCTVEEAKRRKETGEIPHLTVPCIGEICTQYERTCVDVLKCRKLTASNDKLFDLFIIGGGARLRPLRGALLGCTLPGGFVREGWRPLQPPRSLKNAVTTQGDYDFFANACGLASSLSWDYYPPHETPPMSHQPPAKPRQDPDEFYPK
jgi:Tfp pilus assembly PilM family ATPase